MPLRTGTGDAQASSGKPSALLLPFAGVTVIVLSTALQRTSVLAQSCFLLRKLIDPVHELLEHSENAQLRRMVIDLLLDKARLEETLRSQSARRRRPR
jgi:hypothetical protein